MDKNLKAYCLEKAAVLTKEEFGKLSKRLKKLLDDGKKGEEEWEVGRFLYKAYKCKHDIKYRIQQYNIIHKTTRIIDPLTFNIPQDMLWDAIYDFLCRGLPIRIILLKARQWGGSTEIGAFTYDRATYNVTGVAQNTSAAIMSYEDSSSQGLLQMYETFHENYPEWLGKQPRRSTKQAGKWKFKDTNSWINLQTAHKKDPGRSFNYQFLHLSEAAMYPFGESALTAMLNTVSDQNPNTAIFIESTAKGFGNSFHKRWLSASDPKTHTLYKAIFIPWFIIEEYVWPEMEADEKEYVMANLSEEEETYVQAYDWSAERVKWRRFTIEDKCEGNPDKFKEEYPSNPQEAFLTTGECRFKAFIIDKWHTIRTKEQTINPVATYDIGTEGEITFNKYGKFQIFEEPIDYVYGVAPYEYVIAVDTSTGKETSSDGRERDDSVIQILKRGNMARDQQDKFKILSQVAVWRGKIEPILLGHIVYHLGIWYNNALIAVESNQGGSVLYVLNVERNYPFLYTQEKYDKISNQQCKELGFSTTGPSRTPAIDTLAQLVEEDDIEIFDIETIGQMQTFAKNKKGKPEARSGCKDDLVMALAIGAFVNLSYPSFKQPKDSIKESDEHKNILKMLRKELGLKRHPGTGKLYKPVKKVEPIYQDLSHVIKTYQIK